jgi:hypothetical protein
VAAKTTVCRQSVNLRAKCGITGFAVAVPPASRYSSMGDKGCR